MDKIFILMYAFNRNWAWGEDANESNKEKYKNSEDTEGGSDSFEME